METNRANLLIERIRRQATERAHGSLLGLFTLQSVMMVMLAILRVRGVDLSQLLLAALAGLSVMAGGTLLAMRRVGRVLCWAIGEAAVVYAIYPRIVTFEVRDWHIVGTE